METHIEKVNDSFYGANYLNFSFSLIDDRDKIKYLIKDKRSRRKYFILTKIHQGLVDPITNLA